MQAKSWIALKVLLNHYHQQDSNALLELMPDEDAQAVTGQDVESGETAPLLHHPWNLLDRIHYSWIAPAVKSLSDQHASLFLGALSESQRTKVVSYLDDRNREAPDLNLAVKAYVLNSLTDQIPEIGDVLPVEYLPKTPLSDLLDLDKTKLVLVINFLGLYDLADEMRQVVDKKLIEKLYEALPEAKKKFLKICLRQKEKLSLQKLHLERWDGDSGKLKKLLHHRGLVRLGYGMANQHPDFIWHICHVLDSGRGEKVAMHAKMGKAEDLADLIQPQLLTILKQLDLKSTK